ncbi:uncharacterized protein LOC108732960 [Agrilus planipennis]|uniref:Uncharacterized protein LOC108732960 n=1 Tax=Agrilus planipennis TaxID=224129 RepID=A0A1W4W5S5_AGRPL|nr:uncharacterized protein LOC108732960 [Agrilus planipennis]
MSGSSNYENRKSIGKGGNSPEYNYHPNNTQQSPQSPSYHWVNQPPPPPPASNLAKDTTNNSSNSGSDNYYFQSGEVVSPPTIPWHGEQNHTFKIPFPPPHFRPPLNNRMRGHNFRQSGQKRPHSNDDNYFRSPYAKNSFPPSLPPPYNTYNPNYGKQSNYSNGPPNDASGYHFVNQRFFNTRRGYPSNRPYRRILHNKWPSREVNDTSDTRTKSQKKRKKPLSQNNPKRRDWSLDDVIKALSLEKELNKKCKNHSLIIKFPDHELNKDIVSGFHPSIESVHFQQPSTPRFCFITLKESVDPDAVIAALNKQKFGDGYIAAEYKREKEDEQSSNPEDIDPLALYVGNLTQEITKDDMVSLYPRSKRIDIGFAKKMKYTRYAFVRFRTVEDAIEAFKSTHDKQMYNKSLIVRFRRFNGPVGMPGEPKPQKQKDAVQIDISEEADADEKDSKSKIEKVDETSNIFADLWKNADENIGEPFRPIMIKKEPLECDDEDDDEEYESKPIVREFTTSFAEGSIDKLFSKIKPIKVKSEIKKEKDADDEEFDQRDTETLPPNESVSVDNKRNVSIDQIRRTNENCSGNAIKTEPDVYTKSQENEENAYEDDDDDDDYFTPDFSATYKSMVDAGQQLRNISK